VSTADIASERGKSHQISNRSSSGEVFPLSPHTGSECASHGNAEDIPAILPYLDST
jgi:hypothetical protein